MKVYIYCDIFFLLRHSFPYNPIIHLSIASIIHDILLVVDGKGYKNNLTAESKGIKFKSKECVTRLTIKNSI